MKKLNDLFYSFLQVAASTQKLGIHLIRISILIIFCLLYTSPSSRDA